VAADGVYEPVELRKREPADLMDTAREYQDQFERRSLIYKEPGVVELVQRIGAELAPPPTDDYIDYRFYVIRDPSPNAFAMPNGQIYVHTGMLARLEDSSQLAGLLAHEINHVAGHHGILQHRITAPKILIDIFVGGLASLMGQLRYSRELEQEADDRASLLMANTDYDPHALPELFDILKEDFEGLQPRMATIWTTHPDPDKRGDTSRAQVADLPEKPRDRDEFDAIVYPLRAITLRDYIQDDYPYTAIALAEGLLERYPDDMELRMLLGDAWQRLGPRSEFAPDDFSNRDKRRNLRKRVFKTRQERTEELLETEEGRQAFAANMDYARETYESVLAMDSAYAPAHRGLGEVYQKLGMPREAGRHYLEYVRAAPDAADRPVVMGRLTQIRDELAKESGNETN
jgi:predicted Zn-dependent protease